MFYTYILKSSKDQDYYFGHCSDLDIRLQTHNSGKVRSTKRKRPFVIYYFETFQTKSEAYKREMVFKTLSGRQSSTFWALTKSGSVA
jgi:putative endonuclease